MAMARQFFDTQNAPAFGPAPSPTQIVPIQGLASRQLPFISASHRSTPNFNGAWAETERAASFPQSILSPAAWASEFSSGVFAPGSVVQQSATPMKGAFALYLNSNLKPESGESDSKPIFGWKCFRNCGKPLRS